MLISESPLYISLDCEWKDVNHFSVACYMFKSINKISPSPIQDLLVNKLQHTHNTRNYSNFSKPQFCLSSSCKAISWLGPSLYNALPLNIKKAESFNLFKKLLKDHLISDISSWLLTFPLFPLKLRGIFFLILRSITWYMHIS